MKSFFLGLLLFLSLTSFAQEQKSSAQHEARHVNVYAWTGYIPDEIIHQFEKETGIKVNFSTYGNNEIMYAKLRAAKTGYDIIIPSSYFVDRLRRQKMLAPLQKNKLSNWKNLNPEFLHPSYDPDIRFCVPFIWGITGIFKNRNDSNLGTIQKWSDLWDAKYKNQILLLDDTREVFAMALLSLGYSPNDRNKEHIKAAFLKLKTLMQNVKVFSSDTVISIMIDEDANLGMSWNGDAYKAAEENKNIEFIFPQDGFVIFVDNLAIPKTAPHKEEAHAFINFLLRADIAKKIAVYTRFPITNLAGQNLLPKEIQNNPIIYPPKNILRRGQFQKDIGDETLALYEKYWEELKMSG